jgi:hypothetical protein
MTTTTSLDFANGAARLGLSRDDVAELVALREAGDCARVRSHMTALVAARLERAGADLAGLYAEQAAAGGITATTGVTPLADSIPLTQHIARLQKARDELATPPSHGACDGDCPCTRAALVTGAVYVLPTFNGGPAVTTDGQPVVCTLDADGGDMEARLHEWRAILGEASSRRDTAEGVSVTFGHDIARTADLARLMASEYSCCSFGSYHLTVDAGGVHLEIRVPREASDVFAGMFGAAVPYADTPGTAAGAA